MFLSSVRALNGYALRGDDLIDPDALAPPADPEPPPPCPQRLKEKTDKR